MKKYIIFLLIIISVFSAPQVKAETSVSSGIIPGQIWYSKEPLVEGDTVNIHTAVWNGEKNSLSTKVEFYDKNVILGSRDIVLNPSELKDVYVSWKITSGDHTISAKIISSLATISGKKEKVTLSRVSTTSDKRSIAAVVKNSAGETVSGTDSIKYQIDKAGNEISNILPEGIGTSVSDNFSGLDTFRGSTSAKVDVLKNETQKEIDSFKNEIKTTSKIVDQKSNIEDAVQKPIAYIKLFLLSIISLILSNKIIFYGILILIVFFLLRLVYRKIRNR